MGALGVEDEPLSPGLVPYPPLLQNPGCLRRQSKGSGLFPLPAPRKETQDLPSKYSATEAHP